MLKDGAIRLSAACVEACGRERPALSGCSVAPSALECGGREELLGNRLSHVEKGLVWL